MRNPRAEYQRRAVEGASPVGLVVLLYDRAITALMRALDAVVANDIEQRVHELNTVLAILAELEGTLDFERGRAVAPQLQTLYAVVRSRVLTASIEHSQPILGELVLQMTGLRDAWQQVDRTTTIRP